MSWPLFCFLIQISQTYLNITWIVLPQPPSSPVLCVLIMTFLAFLCCLLKFPEPTRLISVWPAWWCINLSQRFTFNGCQNKLFPCWFVFLPKGTLPLFKLSLFFKASWLLSTPKSRLCEKKMSTEAIGSYNVFPHLDFLFFSHLPL